MDKSRDPPKDHNQDKVQLPLESEKRNISQGLALRGSERQKKRRQEGQDDERKQGKQMQSI